MASSADDSKRVLLLWLEIESCVGDPPQQRTPPLRASTERGNVAQSFKTGTDGCGERGESLLRKAFRDDQLFLLRALPYVNLGQIDTISPMNPQVSHLVRTQIRPAPERKTLYSHRIRA